MLYKKGEAIQSKMEIVFGVNEENSKELTGKTWVIDVVDIVDEGKKIAIINVYDDEELEPKNPITTYLPTVVNNHILKNREALVGTGLKFIIEYDGMIKFKDNKSHFGRKTFHSFNFFEAVEAK